VIVPVILAAGASTRMGRAKAALDFGGRTALDLVLDACAGLGEPIVVLGASTGVQVARGRVVVNPDWARGQTSSLKAGLRASSGDFLLFPVDFALVTADDVRAIASASGRIVIPSRDMRRGHPVRFDASLRDEFLALDDNSPARAVVQKHEREIVHVTAVSPYVLMDIDTPEEYAEALKAWSERTKNKDQRPE